MKYYWYRFLHYTACKLRGHTPVGATLRYTERVQRYAWCQRCGCSLPSHEWTETAARSCITAEVGYLVLEGEE